MDNVTIPQIGEKAPEFQAQSTRGNLRFPGDFKGKWVVLLSFPGAFHPVCSSELQALSIMQNRFSEKNCTIVSFSPDSSEAHAAWMRELEKHVPGRAAAFAGIPLIADDGGVISRRYGVWRPGALRPMRGVFIVDPKGIVRAVSFYPLGVGRNMDEIFRLLLALQAFEADGVSIPAGWKPTDGLLHTTVLLQNEHVAQPMNTTPIETVPETPVVQALPPEVPAAIRSVSVPPAPQGQPYEQRPLPLNIAQHEEELTNGAANTYRSQPLRPVSQSVWDALAEAQPQVSPQPATPDTIPMPPFVHTQPQPTAVTAATKEFSTKKEPEARGMDQKGPVKTESVSIADQNRLLLGNLLDKEDAQNGSAPGGHDYLIMRDFPYKT